MKVLLELVHWSFLAVASIIYLLSQFILGLIFVGDEWQTTSGTKYRLRKVIEQGLPVIMGMIAGYIFPIPCSDSFFHEPLARAIYFGFAGGAAPYVHTAMDMSFPSLISGLLNAIRNALPGSNNNSPPPANPPDSKSGH